MFKTIVSAASIALIAIVTSPAMARPHAGGQQGGVVAINPQVATAFAQFPVGGPGLTETLKALLMQDPSLANDIVAAAHNKNPDQQDAAGRALAEAQQMYADSGNPGAADIVRRAARHADPQVFASYEATLGEVVAEEGHGGNGTGLGYGGVGGFGGGGGGIVGGFVSPR